MKTLKVVNKKIILPINLITGILFKNKIGQVSINETQQGQYF